MSNNKSPAEKIEEMLKSYPLMKDKIDIVQKLANKEYSLGSIDYTQPNGGITNNIYQEIEEFVTSKVGNKQILNNLMRLTICIEESMKRLTKNERYIIENKYFRDDMTNYDIMDKLGYMSRQTIYNKRDKAINKIAKKGLHNHYKLFTVIIKEIKINQ